MCDSRRLTDPLFRVIFGASVPEFQTKRKNVLRSTQISWINFISPLKLTQTLTGVPNNRISLTPARPKSCAGCFIQRNPSGVYYILFVWFCGSDEQKIEELVSFFFVLQLSIIIILWGWQRRNRTQYHTCASQRRGSSCGRHSNDVSCPLCEWISSDDNVKRKLFHSPQLSAFVIWFRQRSRQRLGAVLWVSTTVELIEKLMVKGNPFIMWRWVEWLCWDSFSTFL